MKQKIKKIKIKDVVFSVFLVLAAFIFLAPLLWTVSTAFKIPEKVYALPPQWIPNPITLDNFKTVFNRVPFLTYFSNTLIVAIVPVIGQLISVPLVAYSITKIKWKGAKIVFPLVLITMMIPWQVTQIPMFSTWSKLGFLNTFIPLILPAFFGGPYYIYLTRQFMLGIPDSLVEAARIDGAEDLRILYKVIVPMCKPILTTVALLTFIFAWNDLNGPLIYLQQSAKYTLSVGLQNLLSDSLLRRQFEVIMAAVTMFSVPLIAVFVVFQKQFISGIASGGVKG